MADSEVKVVYLKGPTRPHALPLAVGAGLLISAAAVAIIFAVLLATQHTAKAWSPWSPDSFDVGFNRSGSIAQVVSAEYKLGDGRAFDSIMPQHISQMKQLKLTDSLGTARKVSASGNITYKLNLHKHAQNRLLSERQALELALYSFHYMSSVTVVVVLVPTFKNAQGAKAGGELFVWQRKDLAGLLAHPLADSLRPLRRVTPAMVKKLERSAIAAATHDHVYTVSNVKALDQAGDFELDLTAKS